MKYILLLVALFALASADKNPNHIFYPRLNCQGQFSHGFEVFPKQISNPHSTGKTNVSIQMDHPINSPALTKSGQEKFVLTNNASENVMQETSLLLTASTEDLTLKDLVVLTCQKFHQEVSLSLNTTELVQMMNTCHYSTFQVNLGLFSFF
jgi:hypothetical protein